MVELWKLRTGGNTAAAAAKLLQSCLTLCDPRDGSPPVPVILQARTLERVAFSFSNAWKWKVKVKSLSHVRLLATPWTAAYQASPSMWFSRQEYWSLVPVEVIEVHFSYFKSYKMMLWKCCTQYPANLENSAVATGLEKVSFHSDPKVRQCQRMLKLPHSCTYLTH